jgi:hypothetical protein
MGRQPIHENAAPQFKKTVFFYNSGSEAVTISKGLGLCYNYDWAESGHDLWAADKPAKKRAQMVEKPASGNKLWFAGWAVQDYTIGAGETKAIHIYEPGSVCQILTDQNCTVGTTYLQVEYDPDTGYAGALNGAASFPYSRGSALALQTVNRSGTAGLVLAKTFDGWGGECQDNS